MDQHPLLIRHIKHLTDARYFAAMGVDWMSIQLTHDPASFLLWHSLRNWVEGVKLAAEVDADDEALLARAIIEAQPEGMILTAPPVVDIPREITFFLESCIPGSPSWVIQPSIYISSASTDIPKDWNDLDPLQLFIQVDWNMEQIESMLRAGYAGGFYLTGGDEEITGVRDYAMMDDALALIRS